MRVVVLAQQYTPYGTKARFPCRLITRRLEKEFGGENVANVSDELGDCVLEVGKLSDRLDRWMTGSLWFRQDDGGLGDSDITTDKEFDNLSEVRTAIGPKVPSCDLVDLHHHEYYPEPNSEDVHARECDLNDTVKLLKELGY